MFAEFTDVFLIHKINYLEHFLKFASITMVNYEARTKSMNF